MLALIAEQPPVEARRNLVDNSSDLGRLDQLDLLLELVETSFPISTGSII